MNDKYSKIEEIKPIYQIDKIKSLSKPIHLKNSNIEEEIGKIIVEGFFVAYLNYAVLIGRVIKGKLFFHGKNSIELKHIIKLRCFNLNNELLIWRESGKLSGRLRKDESGEESYVIDAIQALFGTHAIDQGNNFTKLTEERGTELLLPFPYELLKDVDDKKIRVFLKTRNYIGRNSTEQADFVDCRFIGFVFQGNDLK